jgi:hypothetical protein
VNALVLVISNLFSFVGGLVVCRWFTMRVARTVKERHMPHHDREPETATSRVPGSGVMWLVIGVMFVVAGGIGAYATWQSSQTKDCLRDYISSSVQLSIARDDAQQQLWDDFATFQDIDPTDEKAVAKLRTKFFDDLQIERDAAKALNHYRQTHKPSKACPS